MKRVLFDVACWTWCLPQTLLGGIIVVWLWWRGKLLFRYDCHLQRGYFSAMKFVSGFSLGWYQVLGLVYNNSGVATLRTQQHEWGHCVQSLILGPLYLIVVGVPSVCNNLLARVFDSVRKNYYRLYPERWADRLGGVTRG